MEDLERSLYWTNKVCKTAQKKVKRSNYLTRSDIATLRAQLNMTLDALKEFEDSL